MSKRFLPFLSLDYVSSVRPQHVWGEGEDFVSVLLLVSRRVRMLRTTSRQEYTDEIQTTTRLELFRRNAREVCMAHRS